MCYVFSLKVLLKLKFEGKTKEEIVNNTVMNVKAI